MNTGVYKITNIITGDCYIGSASRIGKTKSQSGFTVRFDKHLRELRNNSHHNRFLQNSFNKHGENSFKFEILAKCPSEYCIRLEQWFLDNLNPKYNIRVIADSNKGIKFTEEHKEKIRIGNLKENNPEKGIKISRTKTGKARPEWVKEKLSLSKMGKSKSEQGRIDNRDKRRKAKSITKLNEENVIDIKIMLANNFTMKECAEKYKVHVGTIQCIKDGRTWSDIKI